MVSFESNLQKSIKKYEGITHPIDAIGYKLKGYNLADKLGIKHAKVYGIFEKIEDIDWKALPNEFVIHPQRGYGGNGVLPLVYDKGKYKNILKNIYMTREEVILYFVEKVSEKRYNSLGQPRHSRDLWIEELLGNPVPYDWKIYTFNGESGIILQYKRDHEVNCKKLWTTDWISIDHGYKEAEAYDTNEPCHVNNTMPLPVYKNELLEVARELSIEIKHPFVRVDLYDTPNGVYLGELTPLPGQVFTFTDYWDKRLGEMWEKAEEELK